MKESLGVRGRVRVRAHPPGAAYHRGLLASGRVLVDEPNTLNQAGLDHIAKMLLADPITDPKQYGITEMALLNASSVEIHKGVLTDQYRSGSAVVNVLFLPSILPAAQPVNIAGARLYVDELGDVLLASKVFDPVISKTNLLSLTLDWTITLAAG